LEIEATGQRHFGSERQKVFERCLTIQGEAHGLGLSIVGEICRAHRAEIRACTRASSVLCWLQVRFPA